MKKSIKWALVVVDIIAVLGIIYTYYVWINNRNNDKPTDDIVDTKKVTYKKFTYEVPKDMSYSKIDEYSFELVNDGYRAIIEIIWHDDTNMLTNPDLYYDEITELGLKVSEPERIQIDDVDIVKYNKTNEEDEEDSALYYFRYDNNYDYEVELYGDEENLSSLMDILLNAEYDADSDDEYIYVKWSYDE